MSSPVVSAPSEEVAALHAQVRHYESELTERDAVIAQRDAMIEHLQEQVRVLRHVRGKYRVCRARHSYGVDIVPRRMRGRPGDRPEAVKHSEATAWK